MSDNKGQRGLAGKEALLVLDFRIAARHFVAIREQLRVLLATGVSDDDPIVKDISMRCAEAYGAYYTTYHAAKDGGVRLGDDGYPLEPAGRITLPPHPPTGHEGRTYALVAKDIIRVLNKEEETARSARLDSKTPSEKSDSVVDKPIGGIGDPVGTATAILTFVRENKGWLLLWIGVGILTWKAGPILEGIAKLVK